MANEPKDRLKQAREAAGYKTASEAARANREINNYTILGNENGNRAISRKMAEIYAKAFNVSAGWLLYGEGDAEPATVIGFREYALPRTVRLTLKGRIAAGVWREDSEMGRINREMDLFADPRYPISAQYLLEVEGQSLNKRAQDGDLLHCVDYIESGLPILDGDLAIIARSSDQGARIERTAKLVVKRNGVIELRPESTDPDYQQKIEYRQGDEEDTTVQVVAKVIWIIKPA